MEKKKKIPLVVLALSSLFFILLVFISNNQKGITELPPPADELNDTYCNSPCNLGGGYNLTYEKEYVGCEKFNCYVIFNFSLNKDYTITSGSWLTKGFKTWVGRHNLTEHGFRLLKKVNVSKRNKSSPIYGNVTYHQDCMGSQGINFGIINSTHGWCNDSRCAEGNASCYYEHYYDSYKINASGLRFKWNEWEINDYTIIQVKEDKWIDFNPVGKTIEANKGYTLMIWGKKYPELGPNAMEVNARIKGKRLNLSWWNTSYKFMYRGTYNFTDPDFNYHFQQLVEVNWSEFNATNKHASVVLINDSGTLREVIWEIWFEMYGANGVRYRHNDTIRFAKNGTSGVTAVDVVIMMTNDSSIPANNRSILNFYMGYENCSTKGWVDTLHALSYVATPNSYIGNCAMLAITTGDTDQGHIDIGVDTIDADPVYVNLAIRVNVSGGNEDAYLMIEDASRTDGFYIYISGASTLIENYVTAWNVWNTHIHPEEWYIIKGEMNTTKTDATAFFYVNNTINTTEIDTYGNLNEVQALGVGIGGGAGSLAASYDEWSLSNSTNTTLYRVIPTAKWKEHIYSPPPPADGPPAIKTTTLTSPINTSTSPVNCSATITDPDGTDVNVTIALYNGTNHFHSCTYTNQANGTSFNCGSTATTNWIKNAVINCTVYANSSGQFSQNSSSDVTVSNIAPNCISSAQSITLGETKWVNFSGHDPDVADGVDTFVWTSNLTDTMNWTKFITSNSSSYYNPCSSLVGAHNISLQVGDGTGTDDCSYILTVTNCSAAAAGAGKCPSTAVSFGERGGIGTG